MDNMDSMDAMDDGRCCPRLSVLSTFTKMTPVSQLCRGVTCSRKQRRIAAKRQKRFGHFTAPSHATGTTPSLQNKSCQRTFRRLFSMGNGGSRLMQKMPGSRMMPLMVKYAR